MGVAVGTSVAVAVIVAVWVGVWVRVIVGVKVGKSVRVAASVEDGCAAWACPSDPLQAASSSPDNTKIRKFLSMDAIISEMVGIE